MQSLEILGSELIKCSRWKVEIFIGDNSAKLKSSWPTVSLDSIAEESTIATDPQDYEEEFYYIGLENIESITGDIINLIKRNKNEIKSRSKIFDEGNVLYGRLRPYLRKVFLVDTGLNGLCSTELIVLKPHSQKVIPEILTTLLASEEITKQISRLQIGSALPRVSARDFMKIGIPLPPLEIQEELAIKLKRLREERIALKIKLEGIPTKTNDLIKDVIFV